MEIVFQVKKEVERLASRYGISYAIIFGSLAEGRWIKGESDVDLAIKLKRPLKKRELFKFLSKFLFELGIDGVDICLLNCAPPEIAHDALTRGNVVYCANRRELTEDRLRSLKWHDDWKRIAKWFEGREMKKLTK